MLPAMQPADDPLCIDYSGTGKLRRIGELGRAPVLPEAGGFIRLPAAPQIFVGEATKQIVILQTHRKIAFLAGIRDGARRIAELRSKGFGLFCGADHDEPHVDAGASKLPVELAQLRERFTKERSTNVPQPHDKRRQRRSKPCYGFGHRIANLPGPHDG